MSPAQVLRVLIASLILIAGLTVGLSGSAGATPPNIPSETTARSELSQLRVAPDGSMTGYSRDKFPHWITISGSCNTRETVLKRDGTNVVTDSSCAATSGSWYSPYDGATWSAASDVDIDHIVPLANSWRTGASSWTTAKRQQFANDLTNPQLIAVTDNVNQAKGDQSPATWKPPRTTYWCTYAKMWTHTKYRYALTITSAEKSALTDMLNRC
jgi:hypothetical protein